MTDVFADDETTGEKYKPLGCLHIYDDDRLKIFSPPRTKLCQVSQLAVPIERVKY